MGAGTGALTGGAGTGALVAVNATVNNYLTHAQWNEYAAKLDACGSKAGGCSSAEQAALRKEYTTLSDQQNAALATCTTNCAQLTKDVAAGTAQMLVLIGQDKLPGVTGSTINDLGQNIGQNLASNPTLRAQVSDALAVKALCVSNPGACDRQALAAAALVVLPILGVAGGIAAMEALIAAGRLGAAELGLFKTMGPTAYCSINPVACLAAVEMSAGIVTGANAPSVLPLGPVVSGGSKTAVRTAEQVAADVAAARVIAGASGGVTTVDTAVPTGSPIITRFVNGVTVVDRQTGAVFNGTVDLQPTFDRIATGATGLSKNDGSVFRNGQGLLPSKPPGYYTEYVVPTLGINGPGPQRIVTGQNGEMFYTPDHYLTFIPVKKP